jgi:hypothetical protein
MGRRPQRHTPSILRQTLTSEGDGGGADPAQGRPLPHSPCTTMGLAPDAMTVDVLNQIVRFDE